MKNFKPFGPSIGKSKISRNFLEKLNKEVDTKIFSKSNDYSPKLASQIKKEVQISKSFIKKNLEKELIKNIKIFLTKENIKKIKEIRILNLWVVSQYKNEYNPIHYHEGHLSAVGYLKVPKNLNKSKKQVKTNGTIDFINGSKNFLCESIHNHVPKVGDIIFFPNYLMHTAYPFHVEGERRSFSLNIQLDQKITNIHD